MSRPDFLTSAFDEARCAARRSRDPSTQVGAAIFRPDKTLASKGYNGFPRGVQDLEQRYADRPTKYLFTVHAELNALLTAREPLHGYTLISTLFPCAACAGAIVQAGIACVYAPEPKPAEVERWGLSFRAAQIMFAEAGVVVRTEEGHPLKALDEPSVDVRVSLGSAEPEDLMQRLVRRVFRSGWQALGIVQR